MFVVAGVSGNTGSVVASTLLERKAPVRVIVRDAAKGEPWKARGAEVAVADLADGAAVTAALKGAKGAYLLVPPRPTSPAPRQENRGVIAALAAAITANKVPHVTLLSSVGAQHADGTGPIVSAHDAEEAFAPLTDLSAVRAAFFMENWLGSLGALAHDILPTFVDPTLRFSQVATADIGRTAAAALLEGPRGQDRIELSGPRELSANDVAAVLSQLTGKKITATQAPLEAVVPTFTGFGMSQAVAELFRELYAGQTSGLVAWSGKGRALRGTVEIAEVLRPALAKAA